VCSMTVLAHSGMPRLCRVQRPLGQDGRQGRKHVTLQSKDDFLLPARACAPLPPGPPCCSPVEKYLASDMARVARLLRREAAAASLLLADLHAAARAVDRDLLDPTSTWGLVVVVEVLPVSSRSSRALTCVCVRARRRRVRG
jgi:hypothetical protein